jgi:2-polyprenyl-3-methyl-5-hydroxy-6-metoxy-1,4-benzoquinol methylase
MTRAATDLPLNLNLGPATTQVVEAVLAAWPIHRKFLRSSLSDRSDRLLDTTEVISDLLLRIANTGAPTLEGMVADYRYLCEEIVFPEELFFQREGRYRLSTFDEAYREVYGNNVLMTRYMNGLLVSDVLWVNHASAMDDYAKVYLPTTPGGGRHLEIGPGHGMLLDLSLKYGNFSSLNAWDVSATSIQHTQRVLNLTGNANRVKLSLTNMYSTETTLANEECFDTIVLSEVLEHLEQPAEAIHIIKRLLAPGGEVWINVPANGPAPDHLFLIRSLSEAVDLVKTAGLQVTRATAFPVAGASLERAVTEQLPLSCVVVGAKVP